MTSPHGRAGDGGERLDRYTVQTSAARERIVEAAYDLFSRQGVRAVGVDTIIAQSGVAKMTLYRNFASKDELVLEFLRVREQRWTRDWLQAEAERRATTADGRLLAIFDVFHDWFQLDEFEGCSFVNVLLEVTDVESPVRRASVEHLATIRSFVARSGARGRDRGSRCLRPPVAHPDEGLDRLRERGRPRGRPPCAGAREAPARAGGSRSEPRLTVGAATPRRPGRACRSRPGGRAPRG